AVRAGRVADPAKIDRYVLGTCRNVVARVRGGDARAPHSVDDMIDELRVDPVELVDRRALFRCLGGLDARSAHILMLSFPEERSADEIGAALAMTAVAVRVARHRALAALRACLEARS